MKQNYTSKSGLIQLVLTPYFRVKAWWPMWFYVLNREGWKLFKKNPPKLSGVAARVSGELREKGIATTSLEELFPGENKLEELVAYANKRRSLPGIKTKKEFLRHLFPPKGDLDFSNPFMEISLRDNVLAIVNSYMQMWSKFKYYTLAVTEPVSPGTPPVQSQRWHRDPEEKRMCKMFIYLSDVDESSGPFIYVPKSVYSKKYGNFFPQKPPYGSYPEEGAVEKNIPANDIKTMTGKAGTVIFCDTTGLHRGGYATGKERTMFTAFYAAKTYKDKPWYSYPEDFLKNKKLSPEILYALKL